MNRLWCILWTLIFSTTPLFSEETERLFGTVTRPGGKPVANATLTIEPGEIVLRTDEAGIFSAEVAPGTYTIVVEAPGCEVQGESFTIGGQGPLQLDYVLYPRRLQFEEIVIGSTEAETAVSVSSPTSSVEPSEQIRSTSVLSSVTDIAGVAPLGQGGLFQVPSIRGAARERTILLLEAVRVTSERRTGPSFSFVDPLFLETIHVTRGPAPILYGSNGETGLIQAQILEPSVGKLSASFRAGYQGNSEENWQALTVRQGTDRFQYVVGAARRDGSDYESGDEERYPAGFNRVNLVGKFRWLTDAGALTFLAMPTWTDDIEKASSDARTRPTLYPEERHQVYLADWQNLAIDDAVLVQVQGWFHPSSLITQDERISDGAVTSRNVVYNDTDDYGVRFRIGRSFSESWRFYTGVDIFGRTNVNASQDSFEPSSSGGFDLIDSFYSIRNGSYTDVGLFLTGTGRVAGAVANGGVRVQRVNVANHASEDVSDSEYSWSGNIGFSYPFARHWEGVINLGRGIRPATISEKFFTGETGRGSITGNQDLVTESNLELDGGIRYRKGNGFAAFYLFRNDINDFIARVRVEGDRFTYFNLPDVAIYGVEGEGFYRFDDWRLYGNFHVFRGHDGESADINDIPPSRFMAGIGYEPTGGKWMASVEMVRQFEKSDPGPDELERDAAFVLNAYAGFQVSEYFELRVAGSNLTNEAYYDSADNRAPQAIGRSLSVELVTGF